MTDFYIPRFFHRFSPYYSHIPIRFPVPIVSPQYPQPYSIVFRSRHCPSWRCSPWPPRSLLSPAAGPICASSAKTHSCRPSARTDAMGTANGWRSERGKGTAAVMAMELERFVGRKGLKTGHTGTLMGFRWGSAASSEMTLKQQREVLCFFVVKRGWHMAILGEILEFPIIWLNGNTNWGGQNWDPGDLHIRFSVEYEGIPWYSR